MPPRFRDLELRRAWGLLWPYITLLVIGLIGRWLYPHNMPAPDLAHALFDACAVAGILAIVVELSSSRRLIQHVADELSNRLIGRGLPRSLQAKIEEIVRAPLVRERHVKRYRLSDPSPEGKITLDITWSYEVRNYSHVPHKYVPYLGEEWFYHPEFASLVYCAKHSGQTDSLHSFSGGNLQRLVQTDGTTRALIVRGPDVVVIQPIRDDREARCEVAWKYKIVMPDEYSDITSFGGPSIGLVVHLDSCPTGYDFDVTGGELVADTDHQYWSSGAAFLQGQHVRARWSRRT